MEEGSAGAITATGKRRRFTVGDYHRMAEAGILGRDDRVELLDGAVVEMAPIGPLHAGHVNRLTALFTGRLGSRAVVSVRNPVVLSGYSELQPDLVLLRPRADFYTNAHPQPPDILLIVEVADTTAALDRRVKVPLYAAAGVREVWLLDLPTEGLEVYRDPTAGGYRDARVLARGERLAPQAFPDLTLEVSNLLG
jgi:Uma2 family endonuclease